MEWLFALTVIISTCSFIFSIIAIVIAWNNAEVHVYHEQDKDKSLSR